MMPPCAKTRSSSGANFSDRPRSNAPCATRYMWPAVNGSRVSVSRTNWRTLGGLPRAVSGEGGHNQREAAGKITQRSLIDRQQSSQHGIAERQNTRQDNHDGPSRQQYVGASGEPGTNAIV